jgi:hypothetical protein
MISISKAKMPAIVAASSAALLVTLGGASSAHADESGPVVAGTGWTDVSTLDVQGWEGADPAKAPPPVHPQSAPTPRTDKIACNGRKDFYRVIRYGGGTTCFQRSGTLLVSPTISTVLYVCPGNNAGQVEYYEGLGLGGWKYSQLRDGHANFDACWQFGRPTTTEVRHVRIR